MRINATGPGRKGTIDEGVGRLVLSHPADGESKNLLILYEELRDGNLGFWTPIMWAARYERLSAKETKMMEEIIDRVQKEFTEFLESK